MVEARVGADAGSGSGGTVALMGVGRGHRLALERIATRGGLAIEVEARLGRVLDLGEGSLDVEAATRWLVAEEGIALACPEAVLRVALGREPSHDALATRAMGAEGTIVRYAAVLEEVFDAGEAGSGEGVVDLVARVTRLVEVEG